MASGHWVQRQGEKDDGRPYTYWVWVPDPVAAAPAKKNAAWARQQARLRAEQARRRAQAAAKTRAAQLQREAEARAKAEYQRRLAEARRKAYEELKARQLALVKRAGVIGGALGAAAANAAKSTLPPGVPGRQDERQADIDEQRILRERRIAAQQAQAAAAAAAAKAEAQKKAAAAAAQAKIDAEKKRILGYDKTTIRVDENGRKRVGPKIHIAGGVKNDKDAKSVEALLKNELDKAKKGNGSSPDDIRALQAHFEKYAQGVYDKYKGTVASLNALLAQANNKKLSTKARIAAWNKAKVLYNGAYKKDAKEFTRLFGDGTKQGAYVNFYKTADQISLQQREWWKSQMKASLQSELQKMISDGPKGHEGEANAEDIAVLRKQLDIINEQPNALGQTIDHYETWTDASGKEHSRPVYRKKTIEEALQDQQAQLVMKQEQLRAEWQRQEQVRLLRDKNLMRSEGLVYADDGKTLVDPADYKFKKGLFADAQSLYGVGADGSLNLPTIKRSEDLQHVADDLVRQWEKRNPPPKLPNNPRAYASPAYRAWMDQRKAYESQVYKFFGSDTPGLLDRLFTLPGVSHALAGLQGGTAAIGAGGRIILKGTTGSSELDLGINVNDLPEGIKKEVKQKMYEAEGPHDPWGVPIALNLGAPVMRDFAKQDVLTPWFQTPEGQAWLKKYTADKIDRLSKEDAAFLKGFYGEGDLGDKLDALNAYGSKPFSGDTANLLFNLLADPTNAIPLKFTTYLARAKYAGELAQGASKLNPVTWAKGAKNFLTVDEGVLKLESKLGKYEKQLKSAGTTTEQAAEDLRKLLAGITDPSEAQKAFEHWAQKLGLDPKDIHEGQIFNLAEWAATKRAGETGNLFTQQKTLAEEFSKREAAEKAAAAKRLAEQKAARNRVQAATEAAVEKGKTAQERLAIQREADEAALKSQADALAGARAAAAPEAVGKSPEPAKLPTSQPGPLTARLQKNLGPVESKVKQSPSYAPYKDFHEYYTTDAGGNLIPKDKGIQSSFMRTPEYRQLVKAAKGGDEYAQAQLAYQAKQMRNAFRTAAEDAPSVRISKFTPTSLDVAERAGVLGDDAAEALLAQNRATVRHLKRVGEAGNADPYIQGFRSESGLAERAPAQGKRLNPEGKGRQRVQSQDAGVKRIVRDVFDSESDDALSTDVTYTGHDLLEARDSFRGLHEVYDAFTHNSLGYYLSSPNPNFGIFKNLSNPQWVLKKLSAVGFAKMLDSLPKGIFGEGAAMWRDGGMAVFEVFHQLRLAGAWDKLHEFSTLVDELLKVDESNLFAWQWKVMEHRAGIPWALSDDVVETGFKDAARVFSLDPELALSSIPNGYRAQRPPLSFGLSPNLRHLADSDGWLPAPAGWVEKNARDTVTSIFTRGIGEPMQVVHYVASRFGDFVKATPVMNRVMGELTHLAIQNIGLEELTHILAAHVEDGSELAAFLKRRPDLTVADVVRATLRKPQAKTPKGSFLRPDYGVLREEVWRAYWAGELPIANPRAHELMYLIHMQNTGTRDAMVAQTRQFMRYMDRLGQTDRARAFLQRIHATEFRNLNARYVAEMKHGAASADALTGEAAHLMETSEWQMWKEMGFTPDDAKLLARDKAISRLQREAEEIAEGDAKREGWLREEREKPTDAYTGVVGEDMMDDLVTKVEAAKHADEAYKPVISIIKRMADTGGMLMTAADGAMVDRMVTALRDMPGGTSLLRRIQDSIGDGILAERLSQAGEKLAYQEATLRVRLRVMETPSGAVRPAFKKAHDQLQLELEKLVGSKAGKTFETVDGQTGQPMIAKVAPSRRVNLDEMRKQYEASVGELPKDPKDVHIEPATAPQAILGPTDGAAALLERISKMSEDEWYEYAKEEARKVLRSKAATREQKAAARARIEDIDLAQYARTVEKQRGTHVPWQARANAKERVVAKYGKDAEEYIAPKTVAPYARDAFGATVEQVRTWVGALRRAPAEDAPGIGKLGPGHAEDHFSIALFDEVEQEVATAIHEARGWSADTVTRGRGARRDLAKAVGEDPEVANASRFTDRDPVVLKAKLDVLNKHGISLNAYDEARKVLWRGYVQRRTNQWLIKRTEDIVARTGADFDEVYLKLRAKVARDEAKRQLGSLAFGEMFGSEPQAVFDEFVARYGNDGNLRYTNHPLSAFQRRTLEQAIAARSGVADLDSGEMAHYLQSANRPPFEKGRDAVRKWLVQHGSWSPRKASDFTLGKESWSIEQEARYWGENFGYVPDWANAGLLSGSMNAIFHNDELYYAQMRAWGVLDRSMDLKLRLDGTDAKAIERARVKGDPALGIPARRELEAQRRYVVERYGDLVGVKDGDGVKLTAMPWLMYPDEISTYLAKRASEGLPDGLIQTQKELDEVVGLIEEEMKPLMDKLLADKAGEPILYEDIYAVASEVQARLLADPKWKLRLRDRLVGRMLDRWTGFNRWLVFSNPSFLVMNVVDVPIKGAWYRATRRGLFNPGLHGVEEAVTKKANELTPAHLGLDAQTTIYRLKQRKAVDYVLNPRQKGMAKVLDIAQAPFRAIPEAAGTAEMGMKMQLARGMYPQVYARALKRLGDPELADVWSRTFIKDEINRMWPTAGDGPFERLFNRVVPFGSYMVRNKVLFLSEALAHPSILNKIEDIGAYIEQENLKNWEKDHPGEDMPDYLRRRIELPWAKGYYLDLGQFSDATRGLKPLFNAMKEQSVGDFMAQWVRIINPSAQAGIYMITNALGITQKTQYIPVLDENGYPTGQYRRVTTGWTEPWSQNQPDLGSVFWFVDAAQSALEFSDQGFTTGELSQMVGQVFLFNAVSTYDRGTSLFTFWKALNAKDPEGARAWLDESAQGKFLKAWMLERASKPRDVMDALNDYDRSLRLAKYADWFALSAEDRKQISTARDTIRVIRDEYGARLTTMTPGTQEYRDTKAQMYYLINNVYLNNPALLKEEVWSKSASEWATQTADWQTDKLMDDYMALAGKRPQRANYASSAAYNAALATWESSKRLFLKTYPEVEKRLGTGIAQLDSVRDQMNKDWDETLKRISARNEQIDAAKAILAKFGRDSIRGGDAQDQLDILYLQNELDYSLLNKDYAAVYFAKDDFQRLPAGVLGPPGLKPGISLPRMTVLGDFATVRMDKAIREGRLDEFMAQEQYGRDMKAAILYAKGGDQFGEFNGAKFYKYLQDHPGLAEKYFTGNPEKKAKFQEAAAYISGIKGAVAFAKSGGSFDPGKFVDYLKSHPKLLEQYFKRHPEKRAQWARTDAYIKHISVWGKLAQAGRWDEANKVWANMPQWVKDQYYAKHPEKRARAQQTAQYLGYMKTWVKLFDSSDKNAAMKYFNSLPQWAKERYYKAHPDKRVKFETDAKMWGKLANYFASDPANQALYLSQNPDLARWLAQNAGSSEAKRVAIMEAYRAIPKEEAWLRKVFREKYPDVFGQQAAGERKLKRVFETLVKHPEVSDEFEKWVNAIWSTYAEMLKHGPRPLSSYIHPERDVPARKFHKSLSAAEASR